MNVKMLLGAVALVASIHVQADEQFEVNYGVVEKAEELSSGFLRSKFGYTVKLVDSGKRVRLESKTKDILVGDCVAVDTKDDETRIRRVAISNCPAHSPATAIQQESAAGGGVVEEAVPAERPVVKAVEAAGKSPACEAALQRVREAQTARAKVDARRQASKVCQ
jgi:hypothetical protein